MTVHLDTRPNGVDVMFRPGNSFTLVLTWPESLTGRTFTSSVSTQSLSLTYSASAMTIVMSDTQTDDFGVDTPLTWALSEGVNDLLVGTWVPSYDAGTRTSASVSVSTGVQSVTVDASGSVDVSPIYTAIDSLSDRIEVLEGGSGELNFGWYDDDDWDSWDIETISAPTPVNTFTLTTSFGVGTFTATGPPGASSNDRRLFVYNNPEWTDVTDVEIRANFVLSSAVDQFGLGVRCGNGVSLTPWTNIIFGGSGTMLVGLWEFSGSVGTPSIVSLIPENTNALYATDVLSTTGNGTTVTVNTRWPHGLVPGLLVSMPGSPWSAANQTVASTSTALQFTFASSITGSTTSGGVQVVAEAALNRSMAARIVGNRFEAKQWLTDVQAEPAWGDIRYGVWGEMPATTSSGAPAPTSGGVGFMVNHIGESGNIRIRDFRARRL